MSRPPLSDRGAPDPYRTATDDQNGHLVWLASYPKSGNTWVRALLAAYRRADPANFTLAEMGLGANVLSRQWLSAQWGFPTTYLTGAEIRRRLPPTLAAHDAGLDHLEFVKTHDAFRVGDEPAVFTGGYSRRAIVIVRNPLAVAPSLAHHMDTDCDSAVAAMADPSYGLARGGWQVTSQVPQHLGDWSSHVTGWLDQTTVQVTLVRFEELRADTAGVMRRVLLDCGVEVDELRLAAAVAATEFSALRQQEQQAGFAEAMRAREFFRRGEVEGWREELTDEQVRRITDAHCQVMRRLGYVDG